MTSSRTRADAFALAAVCLAALMFGLEISSVPVILPTLERVLHANLADLQWIMNAYTIACTTVLMATGTLADRYGRRRVFVASVVLFGATSLVCGLAVSAPVLIAARFAQGIGGGAMLICLVAILSHRFAAGAARSRAFAIFGVVFGAGLGFGPIVGGAIVAVSSWQWVFLVHAPLAALVLLCVAGGVAESRDPRAGALDVAGIVTLSVSVLCLAAYITQGPQRGYASATMLALAAVAVVAFLLFIVVEKRAKHPMFDFSVFRVRAFSGAIMGSIGMNFSFWPFMIYLPIYFHGVLGYDAVTAGLALLAYTLPTLVLPPLAERLSARYGVHVVIPAGLAAIGCGFAVMRWGSDGATWLLLTGALLAGAGIGITNTPVTNTATGAIGADRAGMASGIDMSARLITLALNIALMGAVLVAGVRAALPDDIAAAQRPALAARIAAGDLAALEASMPVAADAATADSISAARAALAHGFGAVMSYGALGAWVLAVLAALIFGVRRRAPLATCEHPT
jgi:EmrB/QacA subfamily drug resistance transporter